MATGAAEGGLEWRNPSTIIQVAGEDDSEELHAQVADEQQQRDANRPPLGTLVVDVDVGDREVEHDGSDALQNLPATIMPSTVHE